MSGSPVAVGGRTAMPGFQPWFMDSPRRMARGRRVKVRGRRWGAELERRPACTTVARMAGAPIWLCKLRMMSGLLITGAGVGWAAPARFDSDILPVLQRFCWDCHADGMSKGGLSLDSFKSEADIRRNPKVWDGIMFNVDNWLMPPAKKKQPTAEERARLVQWIDDTIHPVDPANPDPGRVTIRRLNRAEYNNTIRDLIGLDLKPADTFPDDDSGYGFDNIGDVLAMPPVLLERYLLAADRILDAAIVSVHSKPRKDSIKPEKLRADPAVGNNTGDGFVLFASGEASFQHEFSSESDHVLRFRAHADQAGDEPAKMTVRVGGADVKTFEVRGTSRLPQTCEVRFKAKKGGQTIAAAFLNDFYAGGKDRNLFIDLVEIEGPFRDPNSPLPESHRRIFIHEKGTEGTPAATRKVLSAFANRAWRRPARNEEIDKLAALVADAVRDGEPWEDAVRVALKATLVSPYFLYRIEWQPEPDNPGRIADLGEFALASRLSYFLWSSMPDERLLSLAFRNQLRAGLAAEMRRMISDPKARALAENFAGQWLEIRNLDIVAPDRRRFREFDGRLRRAMRRETEEFFQHLLIENRSVLDFLSADYTFINERLARHYGIDGVSGDEFRRVALDPSRRRGILTHASVLTVTSVSDPDVAGQAREMGSRESVRHSATAAASERADDRIEPATDRHAPPENGAAPDQSRVRQLPQPSRSDRIRPRKLQRHRRLARDGRRAPGGQRRSPDHRSGVSQRE